MGNAQEKEGLCCCVGVFFICFLKKKKKNWDKSFFPQLIFMFYLHHPPHSLKAIKGRNSDALITVLAKLSSVSPKHNKIMHGQQNTAADLMTTSSLFFKCKKSQ